MFAQRDVSANYKQTVLGPLWFVLQPVLTTATFSFLFGRMADFGTDHTPHFVFYMSGLVVWNYFADCINKTSQTFSRNAQLFGKVYFPRMVVPLANAMSSLLAFMIQFALLGLAIAWYMHSDPHSHLEPNWRIVTLPFLLLQVAMLGLGVGFIISSLTTRYRDLALGVGFGVQLWMYGSSIIFPLSRINEAQRWIFQCNPMVPVIEWFRLALLGHGIVDPAHLLASTGVCLVIFFAGIVMFNRVEQTVMDTV